MRQVVLIAFCAALLGCADGGGRVTPMPEPPPRQSQSPSRAPSAVLSVEPWSFGQSDGSIIRTQHYRVFTTSNRPIIRQVLPGFLEASLVQYRTSMTDLPAPPVKLDTYLMHTRPEWATLTRALMRERAEPYLRIERGGFAASGRGVYRDLGSLSDTLNLAAHEGWHQYTQLTFHTRLPAYLEEGIATYMEGFRFDPAQPTVPIFRPWANTERYDQLRAAAGKDQLFTLSELISSSPQNLISTNQTQALTWYAQVWALVHFLREADNSRYSGGFEQMLQDAAGGVAETTRTSRLRLMRSPLQTYTGKSVEELNTEYQAFIKRITAPGSRDKIVAGLSPIL